MGYVIVGENIYGDPREGSTKAISRDLDIRCDVCNREAPSNIAASYWMCESCHAVM